MIYDECRLLGDGGNALSVRRHIHGSSSTGDCGGGDRRRNIRLGPSRGWIAHGAEAFGRMCIHYDRPDGTAPSCDRYRNRGTSGGCAHGKAGWVHPDSGIAPPLAPSGQRAALTALTPGSRMIFPKPRHAEQLPKDHAVPASNPASPTGHCWR